MRDFLTRHYAGNFDSIFGKGTGKAVLHATAGRSLPIAGPNMFST